MNAVVRQTRVPLRVLHLEDNTWDAELIKTELERALPFFSVHRVDTEKGFEAALKGGGFDVILSDSHLPGFETMKALTRTREVCPEVPFIFVSGTSSPDIKANALSHGATDFIEKDEIPKLVSTLKQLFGFKGEKRALPEIGMPVMVQCREFRCLGYLDRNGKWRDFVRSHELPDVVDWSSL